MIELELWHIISILIAVFAALGGLVIWAVKFIVGGSMTDMRLYLEQQLKKMADRHEKEAKEWQRIEKDLNDLRVHLPQHYVRREDWIRFASVIDAKQDSLGDKLSQMMVRLEGFIKSSNRERDNDEQS